MFLALAHAGGRSVATIPSPNIFPRWRKYGGAERHGSWHGPWGIRCACFAKQKLTITFQVTELWPLRRKYIRVILTPQPKITRMLSVLFCHSSSIGPEYLSLPFQNTVWHLVTFGALCWPHMTSNDLKPIYPLNFMFFVIKSQIEDYKHF